MDIKIKWRYSLCDKGDIFYELYIDDRFLCGFYSLDIIKKRLERYLRFGR